MMSHRDEATPVFGSQNHVLWPSATSPALAAGEAAQEQSGDSAGGCFSFDEAAEEIGGLPEEIRDWVHRGAIVLADAASAHAGRISEQDLRRIERHQVSVDVQRCVKDAQKFLDTKFERFGDKTPRELLDSGDIDLVRDLVWQIKSGAN